MINLKWARSTTEQLHLVELNLILSEIVLPKHANAIVDIVHTAFGDDRVLSFRELVLRLAAQPFPEQLNSEVGYLLFILSTELPSANL